MIEDRKTHGEQAQDKATVHQAAPASDLVNRMSATLAQANNFIVAQMRACCIDGLVPSHGDILMALLHNGTVTMQQLAESAHRDPSTVTALVKKLVNAGYVEAHKGERDRRVTEVTLTAKGHALKADFDCISRSLAAAQMEGISEKDLAITCQTLDTVRENFARALDSAQGRAAFASADHCGQDKSAESDWRE